MGEEILKLRKEGKTYNEIKNILGCSKSTISYYCGKGQKNKNLERTRKRRQNKLKAKVDAFKTRKLKKQTIKVNKKVSTSQNKRKLWNFINKNNMSENKFTWEDILNLYGIETKCYLSGEKINLFENSYHLDHIIPSSRGGNNSINNLAVLHKTVNQMKHNLTPEELIDWCIKILEYNGYKILN